MKYKEKVKRLGEEKWVKKCWEEKGKLNGKDVYGREREKIL